MSVYECLTVAADLHDFMLCLRAPLTHPVTSNTSVSILSCVEYPPSSLAAQLLPCLNRQPGIHQDWMPGTDSRTRQVDSVVCTNGT